MNISRMCAFMCLCLFDINFTSAIYIQITTHHPRTIGFTKNCFFVFISIPLIASICCTCWFCYINQLIAFYFKIFWYVESKGFYRQQISYY